MNIKDIILNNNRLSVPKIYTTVYKRCKSDVFFKGADETHNAVWVAVNELRQGL